MPTPFPGMDPYLEQRQLWPDVHNRLIAALGDFLSPRLRPRYYVSLEERLVLGEVAEPVLAGRADLAVVSPGEAPRTLAGRAPAAALSSTVIEVEVPGLDEFRETRLEVCTAADHVVIAVIEILSPTHKGSGEGRRLNEAKRVHVIRSTAHLVEIDLLRGGARMTVFGANRPYDYSILVSRFGKRPRAELLAFGLRDPIPSFRVPLQSGDDEPEVPLGTILHDLYDRASYDLRIDYRGEPDPPPAEADRAWVAERLRAAGRRAPGPP